MKLGNQSDIIFTTDTVKKIFIDNEINKCSSVENEMNSIELFANGDSNNKYTPVISKRLKNGYIMQRYSFAFGNTKGISESNIRRLLFSISKENIFKQLDDIYRILNNIGMNHRDINPGNLLFDEKTKTIKLIDFYWAESKNIKPKTPTGGINGVYGDNDLVAIKKIKSEIDGINNIVAKQVKNIKKGIISKFGENYNDGSSKHLGKSYHKIDIPYFENILCHRDITSEFYDILKNITKPPISVIDIGCANGYNIFNLIRQYHLEKAIGYEADSTVFEFLNTIKRVYNLRELSLLGKIDETTEFKKADLGICMNVHMWLHKQFGDKVDIIMSNLFKNCKTVFFQTAGAESEGMYKVENLKSKKDIENYLKSLAKKKITFIRTTKYHGGLRHLFKIGS
jgi:hypothetical protein